MDFFGIGPMEIILILILGLLVFGPNKLPQIGRDLGRAFRSFKKAATDMSVEMSKELESEKEALGSFKKATSDMSAEMTKELDGIKEAKEPKPKQTDTQKSEADMLSKPEAGDNAG
jgi:TatA/E family protein of Tat protein translocase